MESFGQQQLKKEELTPKEERAVQLANETAAFEEAGLPPQDAAIIAAEKRDEREAELINPDRIDVGDIKENQID